MPPLAWLPIGLLVSILVMNLLGTQAAFPDTLKLTDWMTDEGAKALETILADPDLYHDAAKSKTHVTEYETLRAEVESLWQRLEELA